MFISISFKQPIKTNLLKNQLNEYKRYWRFILFLWFSSVLSPRRKEKTLAILVLMIKNWFTYLKVEIKTKLKSNFTTTTTHHCVETIYYLFRSSQRTMFTLSFSLYFSR